MKKVLFFCCVLYSFQNYAQSDWQAFKKLACSQKTWVVFHPFKAKKAFEISKEVQRVSDYLAQKSLLDGDKNGGQIDAFKHAYWMALLRQKIGKNAAKSLGKANERKNYPAFKKND